MNPNIFKSKSCSRDHSYALSGGYIFHRHEVAEKKGGGKVAVKLAPYWAVILTPLKYIQTYTELLFSTTTFLYLTETAKLLGSQDYFLAPIPFLSNPAQQDCIPIMWPVSGTCLWLRGKPDTGRKLCLSPVTSRQFSTLGFILSKQSLWIKVILSSVF